MYIINKFNSQTLGRFVKSKTSSDSYSIILQRRSSYYQVVQSVYLDGASTLLRLVHNTIR